MILPTIWESRKATLTFLGVIADLAIVVLAAFGQLETAIATAAIPAITLLCGGIAWKQGQIDEKKATQQ